MDSIAQAYEKNRNEVIPTFVASFFLLFFLYFFYKQLNLFPLQSISVPERIIVVFIVSYVLGKIFYFLGKAIYSIVSFVVFQSDRLVFCRTYWKDLRKSHSIGKKTVSDDVSITRTEIYDYLGNNFVANHELQKLVTAKYFWETFLGGSVIFLGFTYYFYMSLVAPSVIVIISLFASFLNKNHISNEWQDLAVMIKRKHTEDKFKKRG